MTKRTPPKAPKKDHRLTHHNDTRNDPYYWLNNRDNSEVMEYLDAENEFTQHQLVTTDNLQTELFSEMKARVKEDDSSVPYYYNEYWYLKRFEKGKDYPIYSRKYLDLNAEEELLIDVNELAEGYDYFNVTGINISPDNTKMAYGVDNVSRRMYTLYIKDLKTGEFFKEQIPNTVGLSTWAADSLTLFYTTKDSKTLRSDKVFYHKLYSAVKDDILVFHEKDPQFYAQVYNSKSEEYIFIVSGSTMTTEVRFLSSRTPEKSFQIFHQRQRGLEYAVSHYKGSFYVVTNADGATNFKLMKSTLTDTSKSNWQTIIDHREDVMIEAIEIFKDYLVIVERHQGLIQIQIQRWDGSDNFYMPFDNETYTASLGVNIAFDTAELQYHYSSLTTPASVINFNMENKTIEVKKKQEILGGSFDEQNYIAERLWAPSKDGVKIPISVVRRRDTLLTKHTPFLLYGYGAYGHTVDPYFSSVRLSLLDRGFVFGIAHIRGGEYMGRSWYENGRLLFKKNTFYDFIWCSKFLIEQHYTSPNHLYAMGGSAGGLLMGTVINMEPEIYNGVIAAVPFVDVLTTMFDDTIPLTTGEYDEWGNPNDKQYYDYIKSYSPYDNVERKSYPNLLVTSGLHDSQVQYWEPTKWVAKLREFTTSKNLILLHTNMLAGHGGASGRFEALKEIAMEYAFILMLESID